MEQSVIQVLREKKESEDRDNYKKLWAIKRSDGQLKSVDLSRLLAIPHQGQRTDPSSSCDPFRMLRLLVSWF